MRAMKKSLLFLLCASVAAASSAEAREDTPAPERPVLVAWESGRTANASQQRSGSLVSWEPSRTPETVAPASFRPPTFSPAGPARQFDIEEMPLVPRGGSPQLTIVRPVSVVFPPDAAQAVSNANAAENPA